MLLFLASAEPAPAHDLADAAERAVPAPHPCFWSEDRALEPPHRLTLWCVEPTDDLTPIYFGDDFADSTPMAAAAGDPKAMSMIGETFNSIGSYREGALWLQKAALKGDAKAMARLSCAYRDGAGVRRNAKLARKWAEEAMRAGQSTDC